MPEHFILLCERYWIKSNSIKINEERAQTKMNVTK